MNELKIKLATVESVYNFVNKITKIDGDFDIGHGKYTVDAKSIMGIFSLDLSNELSLIINNGDIDKVKTELAEFIV